MQNIEQASDALLKIGAQLRAECDQLRKALNDRADADDGTDAIDPADFEEADKARQQELAELNASADELSKSVLEYASHFAIQRITKTAAMIERHPSATPSEIRRRVTAEESLSSAKISGTQTIVLLPSFATGE